MIEKPYLDEELIFLMCSTENKELRKKIHDFIENLIDHVFSKSTEPDEHYVFESVIELFFEDSKNVYEYMDQRQNMIADDIDPDDEKSWRNYGISN